MSVKRTTEVLFELMHAFSFEKQLLPELNCPAHCRQSLMGGHHLFQIIEPILFFVGFWAHSWLLERDDSGSGGHPGGYQWEHINV